MSRGTFFLGATLALAGTAASASGVIEFADRGLVLSEGDSSSLTVMRTGDDTDSVTIVLSVGVGGTARLGTDYEVDLSTGVVTIEAGERWARVPVDALNRNGTQGTRFATFSLATPSSGVLGPATTLVMQIEDPDSADTRLRFVDQDVLRVEEGSGLTLTFQRSGSGNGDATADLFSFPLTAVLGVDYEDPSVTLEFPENGSPDEARLITLADDALEGPEVLNLFLEEASPDSAEFEGLGPTIVIDDAEPGQPGEFTITVDGNAEVDESVGSVTFLVDRNRGSTGPATVAWVTIDGEESGDAVDGEDYTGGSATLEYADGETRATFEIPIIDDDVRTEDRRRFRVYIGNPLPSAAAVAPDGRFAEVTIGEDDGKKDDDDDCIGFCDCFIATAAFGSGLHPRVATLRQFRDRVLMASAEGRIFVELYNRYSPPLAAWIREREQARTVVRVALWPVVAAVEHPGTGLGVLGVLLLLLNRSRRRPRTPWPGE